MERILVVEDDKILNMTLTYNLKSAGYDVDSAMNVLEAKNKIEERQYALAVLDVNLPDGDGYEVCRAVKEKQNTAIIFVTAQDMESDMLKGYECGADDYVTKPFSVAVFQKKVAAILSRTEKKTMPDVFEDGFLSVDFEKNSCAVAQKATTLTPKEWRLLKIFAKSKKQLLTRQILLEKMWDLDGNFVDDHTLTTTLSGLRKKIETKEYTYIRTVYGMGYMWTGGEGR